MLQARLLSYNDGILRYAYRPEGEGVEGVLSYDVNNNIYNVEKIAGVDLIGLYLYRQPLFSRMKEMGKTGKLVDSFSIAIY